jgi:hypothetical protein
MKLLKYKLAVILLLAAATAGAQIPANKELEQSLKGKNNFGEVWGIITRYYNGKDYLHNPKLFSEFKKWNRWAWWESKHLDEKGNFTRSSEKIFEATQRIQEAQRTGTPDGAQSNSGAWAQLGPQNLTSGIARVDRLAFHPTNPSIIYAGTPASGLWKTTDGGNNWFPLNGFAPSLGVSGIVVDAQNPNVLYVLTGDGDSYANSGFVYTRASIGILKSNDGGATWFKLSGILPSSPTPPPFYGFKLVQLPDFNNVLIAATSEGLFRSTDFGQNWSRCDGTPNNDIFDVEVKPGSSVTLYACSRFGIYISNDYGSSFNYNGSFSQPPTNVTRRSALAVTAASPNTVYINFGGSTTNGTVTTNESLLYRSDNSGGTFGAPVSTVHQPIVPYMSAFTVSPQNTNRVILGALNLIYSADGGTSFNFGANIHADVHDLAYNNGFLYAACDGGVYYSNDNGANWIYLSNGLAATQYYHMSATEQNDNAVIAGAQDNGYMRRSNSGVFSLSFGGDGFSGKFLNNSSNEYIFSVNAGVYKHTISTNTISTLFVGATGVNDQNFFFPSLEVHPTDNNTLYAGYTDALRRSTNGGSTWTALGGSGSAGFGFSGGLAVSAQNPDRLYMATGFTLRISNDKGTTQTVISGNPGWTNITGSITDVTCRPNNADEVWVTFSGFTGTKVLYSSNAGATWVNFTGTLPNLPVYCIKYTGAGDAYIGTDYGVYVMTFNMNDWTPFYNGLPTIPVTDLFVNETDGTLKAATFGRGIWQSDLYTNCGALLFPLTGTVQGRRFYQATNTLQSAQQMNGNLGNELRYRSPEKIRLTNGFVAREGSYLRAVIGPCGQGIFNKTTGELLTKTAVLAEAAKAENK